MKFENKGKWLRESDDTLKTFDTQEHPDFLDGDDKVLTMEDGDDEELMNFEEDELDVVEENDILDSPEEEEDMLAMESSQKNEVWTDIYGILGDIGEKRYFNKQKELSRADMEKEFRKALKIKGLKPAEHDIEVALDKYYEESSQKNEAKHKEFYKGYIILIDEANRVLIEDKDEYKGVAVIGRPGLPFSTKSDKIRAAKNVIDNKKVDFSKRDVFESAQKNEGPDEFKDNKYERDFFEYKNGGHGDFMEYLAKACMQADKKNLAKIQKEFPELTKAFCLWKSSGKTDKAEKL